MSTSSGRSSSRNNEPIYSECERDIPSSHFSRSSSNGGHKSLFPENGNGSGPIGKMNILEDNRLLTPFLPSTSYHSNKNIPYNNNNNNKNNNCRGRYYHSLLYFIIF